MTSQLHQPDELSRLLIGLTDAGLDGAERLRLVEMLRDDPAARTYYLRYMLTDAALRLEHAASPAGGGKGDRSNLPERPEGGHHAGVVVAQIGPVPFSAPAVGAAVELPHQPGPESPTPGPESLALPIIIDTSSPCPAPAFSSLLAPGGWLFSYAAAVVITGMLVLSAWVYRVPLRGEVAVAPPIPASHVPAPPPEIEYVGRIAGTADCRLADPRNVLVTAVPLGRRYNLASGLMEIAYQSGARVILQGPCSYEVDSAAGGFLSLGKLTARVETKGEGGRGKAEGTDHQKSPFPLPPSPFVIRTPTAVVTDLGTEFGVEVGKEGNTTSHVFRGKVELRAAGGENTKPISLGENESAHVERGGDQAVTIFKTPRDQPRAAPSCVKCPSPSESRCSTRASD